MQQRPIGPFRVSAIGLGCMNLSWAYSGQLEPEAGIRLLQEALDLGYTHFDTAYLYGFGANETLLGQALSHRRQEFMLATKCGMIKNAEGQRELDGRPETVRRTCEESLKRLKTEVIDLYYLHRWDQRIPIEESVGAMAELVREGKVRTLGLSEVSSDTLRRAHAVHPITALQTEYSLWTRNPEISVLATCRELGVTFVPFSPLGRGFLCGELRDLSTLGEKDIRRSMPRFYPENYARNLQLLDEFGEMAKAHGCTMAQLALAWLLHVGDYLLPIPGTTNLQHLRDNFHAADVSLDAATTQRLGELINQHTVHGARYNEATQAEVGTEEFG